MSKSKNKTIPNQLSVHKFLNSIEDPARRRDSKNLHKLISEITQEKATMWGNSIIGYGQYHYKYASGREGDFMKVGFSPRKQNLTIYIMPGFERYSKLMEKLGKHKTGKSCLYINKLGDVDNNVLVEIIQNSYEFMTKKYG